MNDREKLLTLKPLLHGAKKQVYENIVRKYHKQGTLMDHPGKVYDEIKATLMKYQAGRTQLRLQVKTQYDNTWKGKNLTGLEFQAAWEKVLAEMKEVGFELQEEAVFIDYLKRVGPAASEEIRKDKRPRADGHGGTVTRAPESWEEAQVISIEI